MKSLIRLVISGAILCLVISIAVSCSEEEDCSMATRAMLQCNLYTIDAQTVKNDTLDSLTVTAYGTDSIIINNQKKVHDFSLPLRYTSDSTKLVFRYSQTKTDTIVIHHANTPYFLSMNCGYQMKQTVAGTPRYTRHSLDSIYVSNKEAGIYGRENIKLFY